MAMVKQLVRLLALVLIAVAVNATEDCIAKLERCNGEAMMAMINDTTRHTGGSSTVPSYGLAMERFCSNRRTVDDCVKSAEDVCSPSDIRQVRTALEAMANNCEYIPCMKKIEACGAIIPGTLSKLFSGVDKSHFPFQSGFTITKEFCSKKDDFAACLDKSVPECPADLITRCRREVDRYNVTCKLLTKCGQSLLDCAGESVKTVKRAFNNNKYNVTTMEQLCTEKDNIVACVAKSSPDCPAEYLTNPLRFQLSKLNASCQLLPCAKKIQACGSTMSDMLIDGYWSNGRSLLSGYQRLNQRLTEVFCSEKDNFTACLARSAPECPRHVIDTWTRQMTRLEPSCKLIPCTKQLNDCGNLTSMMHQTSFDATMLNKVCNDFGTMRKCIAGADKCPPKIISLLKKQYGMYEKQCECRDQLNKCNANLTGILMKRTFDLATLHKVCNELGEIETCVHRANKCSPTYIRRLQTSLNVYKTECTRFAKCSLSVQTCAGQSANTFSSLISNFTVDGISMEKLCAEEDKLSSCLKTSVDCPPDYVRKYEAVMSKVRTHCSRTACAMKTLQCGVDLVDGVDIMKLDNAALLRLCNNLAGVEKCLSTLDQSCRVMTKPITFWTDRCDVFVRKSLCARHICKNGGTCEARTNTATCVCVNAFTGDHCETAVTTTTTKATPSGQRGIGFTTVVIVSSLTASLLVLAGHV